MHSMRSLLTISIVLLFLPLASAQLNSDFIQQIPAPVPLTEMTQAECAAAPNCRVISARTLYIPSGETRSHEKSCGEWYGASYMVGHRTFLYPSWAWGVAVTKLQLPDGVHATVENNWWFGVWHYIYLFCEW